MSDARGDVIGRLQIDRRFNGPPDSGNGGFVCGEIAKALESVNPGVLTSGVRVRLQRPPALETDLELAALGEGCGLFEGDALVAHAVADPIELGFPQSVDVDLATEAARSFRGYTEHVFPGCFVCGPERAADDGLRIFPGPIPKTAAPDWESMNGLFAAPWQPHDSLRAGDRRGLRLARPTDALGREFVDPAFVWAALDCPGAFSFPQPEGKVILLGEMTAALDGAVRVGEPHVLLSWRIDATGRKHTTGTAIYDAAGHCRGYARAIWIEISEG